jgi:hypothetical protein
MTIRTDYTQLGIPNLMTYVEPNLAYANPHLDLLKPERVHHHPRAQYSSNPALGHEGTHYSRHLSTPSARLDVLEMESPTFGLTQGMRLVAKSRNTSRLTTNGP